MWKQQTAPTEAEYCSNCGRKLPLLWQFSAAVGADKHFLLNCGRVPTSRYT